MTGRDDLAADARDVSAPGGPAQGDAAGLPGVRPGWSRYVTVHDDGGDGDVRWHVLDNAGDLAGRDVRGTLLAVHGNPTWSYLWRDLLAAGAAHGWRVAAVDHLGMGLSQRDGRVRRLADRVRELGALTDTLGLTGPVVTVGHDWGGVISLGWALEHRDRLAGVVLTNTAVHHDDATEIPGLLRLAGHPAVHGWATSGTDTFLRTTLALPRPALPDDVREAYRRPYRTRHDRQAIADFVADIPAGPDHPSRATLDAIAEGVTTLDVPALIMWGPRDPVFQGRYLRDLLRRLPQADVHRFERAGHLLHEEADVAGTVVAWLDARGIAAGTGGATDAATVDGAGETSDGAAEAPDGGPTPAVSDPAAVERLPLAGVLEAQRHRSGPAVVALRDGRVEELGWADLATRVERLAVGLLDAGVQPGQRVSLLVTPGVDLTTALFACLRIGAVVVVADQGLGLAGMSRAVRGADPSHLIGIDRALVAARAMGWPGRRIAVSDLPEPRRRALGVGPSLAELIGRGAHLLASGTTLPPEPGPDAEAAVLFTSGSTGPAKGVLYTHGRLAAMRDALGATYGIGPSSALVAGFAPFALLATAAGAVSVTPDMDVTAPATLTAAALADAVAAIDAEAVFASPSALRNVLATAPGLTADQRTALGGVELFLSAGAPIPPELLARVAEIMPGASAHTPYGMTEVLPLTDVDLDEIRAAARDAEDGVRGAGNGTCVGTPVQGARLRIIPLDALGAATGEPTEEPGVTGEVLATAPHLKERYDRLWATQAASADPPGWHRTGDVGHLDARGRLWIEGRHAHVIATADGVLTPVAVEHRVEQVHGVRRAAVVGVGPAGTQQVVVVLETDPAVDPSSGRRPALATPGLTRAVRRAAGVPVAAVLRVAELPTDIRHNSKIERGRLAAWAEGVLAGGRMSAP
ncbi:alpha/beta fold hydrolase [Georgenia faecalis]|uniref:alpha/beta fold hydrolase n=1 Tax=Georgenia faecalis TaxID=2483799 RepID=UPI001F49E921|nr:alpha/beta fold hydrolase [Georgenia faecalis]